MKGTQAGRTSERLTSERPPFSMVPEWLLDTEISDRALRLYTLLDRYTDDNGGHAFPRRKVLAGRLRCSLDSLDRARAELEEIGALTVTRRTSEGRQTTNLYELRFTAPERRGGRTGAEGGGRTHAEGKNENQSEREAAPNGAANARESHELEIPVEQRRDEEPVVTTYRAPDTVDRRRVTRAEATQAAMVLHAWNQATGQHLTAKDWLGKIIMRQREHPEATLDDHALLIRTTLAHPWWKGVATPSVIYGNAAQFERAIAEVEHRGKDDDRVERIVEAVQQRRREAS